MLPDAILTPLGELLTLSCLILVPYSLRNYDNAGRRSSSIRSLASTCGLSGNHSRGDLDGVDPGPSPGWIFEPS
jgi:hypothetical protein